VRKLADCWDTRSHGDNVLRSWLKTNAPAAVFLIRLMVGGVFLSEGIQKFLFSKSVQAVSPESVFLHLRRWVRLSAWSKSFAARSY
jgi:uncharacterized membrane protein YphA (DoxX/SURF4 family)